MPRLRIGSLFTGYGGLDMAVQQVLDSELVWVADNGAGPSKVLTYRHPNVPNLGDITLVDWAAVPPVDILTGGSPCQDLSTAGRRAGMTDGTRSNLWVVMREAIAHVRPKLVVWENVRGALSAGASSAVESEPGLLGDRGGRPALRALGRVVGDLADLGYVGRWVGLRVADLGGCHGRFRIFLVAWPADTPDADRIRFDRTGHAWDGGPGSPDSGSTADSLSLLPTPRATDGSKGGPNQRGSKGDLMLPSAVVQLLPTPAASNPNDGESPESWLARRERVKESARNGNGMGMPLPIAVQLLPTPSVADAAGGHERRGGARGGELLLKGLAKEGHLDRFGDYAPAIASHERLVGRPAPDPTELHNGKPRLSSRFVEWMMCLPDGWVTAVPGVTRTEQLALLGNGVIPPQAVAALLHLLA